MNLARAGSPPSPSAVGRRPDSKAGNTPKAAQLSPMRVGTAPWQKMGALDWPPPPSPAASRFHLTSGLGATSAPETTSGKDAISFPRTGAGALDIRLRAELWTVRADIGRVKMTSVPPQPFFGHAMRFQDEYSALQITADGRFSFSEVGTEAVDGGGRQVVTYEGIFGTSDLDDPMMGEQAVAARSDPEAGLIEGRALMRHEFVECGGRTRIVSVEKGVFRFAITVSPFFQPKDATVQSLARPKSPGRPAARCRRLQYVGAGSLKTSMDSPDRKKIAQQTCFTMKRGPRLKFSKSLAALQESADLGSSFADRTSPKMSTATQLPKLLSASSSAPQLRPPKEAADPQTMSVSQWKEYYNNRSQLVMDTNQKP